MNNIEKIEAIRKHQNNPMLHPLTCGNNSNHKPLEPVVIDSKVCLICLNCSYTQKNSGLF